MRIIVVGCGKVGETIVKCLSSESHDIAVIDVDPGVVEDMSEQFDASTFFPSSAFTAI